MTRKHRSPLFGDPDRHNRAEGRLTARRAGFCLMSAFCFLLILRNSSAAIRYMGRGLTLCAQTVIPSLFPFMVISELLVSSGAGEALGRLFSRMMRRLFGLSGAGASAVFLGSLCGFPVGARTAVSLLDRNVISRKECQHLLTFVSNPSSAFLISAVGLSLFGSRRLGVILYCVVLGCGFLVGFLARFLMGRGKEPAEHPHFPSGLRSDGIASLPTALAGAISSSTSAMLTVCAYVVFFSAVTGALEWIAEGRGAVGSTGYLLLCGLLEMTGGISRAASLPGEWGVILTAAFAGWSGISVHCQVMTLCGGRGLSFRPYLLAKAAQGLLCGGVTALLLRWFPALLTSPDGGVTDAILVFTSLRSFTVPALVTDTLFVGGWILSRGGWSGASGRQ